MEEDLLDGGRVARIETRGRVTGRTVSTVVGFVERADGSVVVAASSPDAHWSLNLLHDPACRVTVGDASWDAIAQPLEGVERLAAVRDLVLRYGTPSESLGAGPAFRLSPAHATKA